MPEESTDQSQETVARFGKRWWAGIVFGLVVGLVVTVASGYFMLVVEPSLGPPQPM